MRRLLNIEGIYRLCRLAQGRGSMDTWICKISKLSVHIAFYPPLSPLLFFGKWKEQRGLSVCRTNGREGLGWVWTATICERVVLQRTDYFQRWCKSQTGNRSVTTRGIWFPFWWNSDLRDGRKWSIRSFKRLWWSFNSKISLVSVSVSLTSSGC